MKPSSLSSEASISRLSFNCLLFFFVSYSILYVVGHFLRMKRCVNPESAIHCTYAFSFTFLYTFHCILLMFLCVGTCDMLGYFYLPFYISKEVILSECKYIRVILPVCFLPPRGIFCLFVCFVFVTQTAFIYSCSLFPLVFMAPRTLHQYFH